MRISDWSSDVCSSDLILSIGVSHGVQYVNAWRYEVAVNGLDSREASIATFRQLFIPGTVAILTDVIGFATLAFIKIDIVRAMALNAAMEIGRASCRERVCQYKYISVGGESLEKQNKQKT